MARQPTRLLHQDFGRKGTDKKIMALKQFMASAGKLKVEQQTSPLLIQPRCFLSLRLAVCGSDQSACEEAY